MTEPNAQPLVELVVLDVAGTTIQEHGAVYQVLREAIEAAGVAPSESGLERWMGADKRQAIAALLGTQEGSGAPHPDEALIDATYSDFRSRLALVYRDQPPTAVEGALEAIEELRANGVKVALTTGFDRDVTDTLLAAVGWDAAALLDAVVTADDVSTGRPAPYLVFRAMEATGTTNVARVLVAGDTVRDLEAGTNAGAGFVIGVLTGGHDADTLRSAPHTHIVAGVQDIPAIVLRIVLP